VESRDITRQFAISQIKHLVAPRSEQETQSLLDPVKPQDIVAVLESSPSAPRVMLCKMLDESQQSEIIRHVDEDVVPSLLSESSVNRSLMFSKRLRTTPRTSSNNFRQTLLRKSL
jgi:Mg/Co/Ni transporter MgtE